MLSWIIGRKGTGGRGMYFFYLRISKEYGMGGMISIFDQTLEFDLFLCDTVTFR